MHMCRNTVCLHVSHNVWQVIITIIRSLLVYIMVFTSMLEFNEWLQEAWRQIAFERCLPHDELNAERRTKEVVWSVCLPLHSLFTLHFSLVHWLWSVYSGHFRSLSSHSPWESLMSHWSFCRYCSHVCLHLPLFRISSKWYWVLTSSLVTCVELLVTQN